MINLRTAHLSVQRKKNFLKKKLSTLGYVFSADDLVTATFKEDF